MKCIAIDDEPIALNIISQYCERRGGMTLETFTSPAAGMRRVKELKPDIVFLDIEMNGTSGVELARELPGECCLIFTTAYANYALDGFEVNAVDFLHKPYFYDRFDRAVRKAEERLRMNALTAGATPQARQLVLKVEYKNVIVSADEISYIEAMENYVKVYRQGHPVIVSHASMRQMEELLPAEDFIRVHRSYIVRTRLVVSFTRTALRLVRVKVSIPIGRKYVEEVTALLGKRLT